MMKSLHVVFCLLLFLCWPANSIKCYRCESGPDGNCVASRLYEGQLKLCEQTGDLKMTRCSTTTTKVSGKVTRIERRCNFHFDRCVQADGVKTCTVTCAGDGCNTASPTRPSIMILTLLSLILAKLLH